MVGKRKFLSNTYGNRVNYHINPLGILRCTTWSHCITPDQGVHIMVKRISPISVGPRAPASGTAENKRARAVIGRVIPNYRITNIKYDRDYSGE